MKQTVQTFMKTATVPVKMSLLLMGAGHFRYGSISKGLLYLFVELSMIYYLVQRGFNDIRGFFTLGTQRADAWAGIKGDNSVVMMLMGIFAFIVIAVFAKANNGRIINATGICKACSILAESDLESSLSNGIVNATKTPAIVA